MEGVEFICPWTEGRIRESTHYDLDHILPVSIYPINELWNLVPSDPDFNAHVKRDRIPSVERLAEAEPYVALAYANYQASECLARAIREDADGRFATVRPDVPDYAGTLAQAVLRFVDQVAVSRNLARF
jgi:hypothetical protein